MPWVPGAGRCQLCLLGLSDQEAQNPAGVGLVCGVHERSRGIRQIKGDLNICVECVNRFETHFLNIAEDAVKYCKDVGTGNIKVHLDCFHMIREETSFRDAVLTCGKEYLGYVHVCESNRGIPGTGLVPFKEFFEAVKEVGYDGPLVIESFDPSFEELNGNCAIWRKLAESGEQLACRSSQPEKNRGHCGIEKLHGKTTVGRFRRLFVLKKFCYNENRSLSLEWRKKNKGSEIVSHDEKEHEPHQKAV